MIQVGSKIQINTPGNPQLHGTTGTVQALTDWGAHLKAPDAATGQYRAAWHEMTLMPENGQERGYTGDCCGYCGSFRMRRQGTCLLCDECGATSGCS